MNSCKTNSMNLWIFSEINAGCSVKINDKSINSNENISIIL
ncbi:MAG TPA: hypothetical protein PLO84_09495 [Thermotogota bacterium]|nr:hypothetical protein [Thermotogota bacterium]